MLLRIFVFLLHLGEIQRSSQLRPSRRVDSIPLDQPHAAVAEVFRRFTYKTQTLSHNIYYNKNHIARACASTREKENDIIAS